MRWGHNMMAEIFLLQLTSHRGDSLQNNFFEPVKVIKDKESLRTCPGLRTKKTWRLKAVWAPRTEKGCWGRGSWRNLSEINSLGHWRRAGVPFPDLTAAQQWWHGDIQEDGVMGTWEFFVLFLQFYESLKLTQNKRFLKTQVSNLQIQWKLTEKVRDPETSWGERASESEKQSPALWRNLRFQGPRARPRKDRISIQTPCVCPEGLNSYIKTVLFKLRIPTDRYQRSRLRLVVLGVNCSPTWQCPETCSVLTTGGRACYWHLMVRAQGCCSTLQ